MLSLEGQQLGNYDVIRRIRVGGMGAVYEGRQRTAFGRRVAIKVILGDYATDRDMRRRFAREAKTIARLHHPHILPLIEFGDEKGILYLVMPFIEGGTLTSYLRRSLPELDEVSAMYQQLLDAVEYAHDAGLVHRDIKSSNVLLEERRSGPPFVYLADFGLVRNVRQPDSSKTGKPIPLDQVPGTPHYMAPEQTRGIVTPLTDIYALGVLLFQMLTGELPYNDPDDVQVIQMHLQAPIPSPSERDASIPKELGAVVRMAMAKRPDDRYQSIAELREAFLAAIGNAPEPIPDVDETDIDEELLIEEVGDEDIPPLKQLPAPLILPLETETKLPIEERPAAPRPAVQRQRNEARAVAVRDTRERGQDKGLYTTDTVRPRQRITEEPVKQPLKRKQKRVSAWVVVTMLVPIILLILLLMPRILGISIFPAGFPIFGTSPIATVYVTPQTKVLQDKYVLTASPKVKKTDLVTHTVPDRVLQSSAGDSNTVQTSGTKTIGGAQARGNVLFTNRGEAPVTVPASSILTSATGQRFQVVVGVTVPGQHDGGKVLASVVAMQPGIAGNIAPHALDGICCNDQLNVSNLVAFSGGSDPQIVHLVAQSDLDKVKNSLTPKLEGEISQQLHQQMQGDEMMAGNPAYTVHVSSSDPIGAQADQVQVTVTIQGAVPVYSKAVVTQTAIQLLKAFAIQSLNSNYQVEGDPGLSAPLSTQAGKDGVAYVSVSVKGVWAYILSQEQISQWRQSIKGATSAAALAYLNSQAGIAAVQINLPFGADHLPSSTEDIKIVTVEQ